MSSFSHQMGASSGGRGSGMVTALSKGRRRRYCKGCFVVECSALQAEELQGLFLRLGRTSGRGFLSFFQEVQQHLPFFPFLTQKSIIEPEAIFGLLITKFCTFISSVWKHVS